jgi:undecaprenyl-diphosphatase
MEFLSRYQERVARLLYPQTLWTLVGLTVVVIVLAVLIRLPATLELDLRVTKYFQNLETKLLTKAARWMTFMGNGTTLGILGAAVVTLSFLGKQAAMGLFCAASLIALPVNVVIKNIVDRKRPGEDQVRVHPGPRWGFSFPSGHSMGTASFYGFLAFLCWLYFATSPLQVPLSLLFALIPIGTGLSRIYLGAHWLSDVVAGWAGGLLHVLALAVLYPA